VQGHNHPWLLSSRLAAQDCSWIAGVAPELTTAASMAAKTRYRQLDAPCNFYPDALDNRRCSLVFSEPQWAVTPGQSAVLYQGDVCLGGGVIA